MRQRYEYLACLTLLAACGGGTMRVAQEEENDSEPVALAPAPEAAPDSVPTPQPEYTSPDSVPPQPALEGQGYAPYGGSAGLEFRRVGQWTRTGISEARRLVIRDANSWAEFWSELGVGDRPEVDFSRDLVVVAAAGQRPSGGHEIVIDRVTQNNGELNISVVETTPGPNCMTTSSLTQPVDVIVVPKVNARNWSFLERKEVRGCR